METLNVDNPVCYLNINSPSKKKTHISEISLHLPMNVLCIDQAKLDSSFSDSQFYLTGYNFPHC